MRTTISSRPSRFTYLHLFPFSARPGTAGGNSIARAPFRSAAVRQRMAALRALIDGKNLAFRSKFIGKQLSAVTLVTSPKKCPLGSIARANNPGE